MSKKSINMIDLCNLAWDRRTKLALSEYYTKTKNLLSHAYVEYKNMFIDFCRNKGQAYEDQVFYIFQHILVFLMMCDDDFLQGEYDCYKTFCEYANFEPLTVDSVRPLYNRLTVDDLSKDISILRDLRGYLNDPDNYEAMVQGFCYFCLSGDKAMDENEYYILRCFFESGDYCPDTWEQFKREW